MPIQIDVDLNTAKADASVEVFRKNFVKSMGEAADLGEEEVKAFARNVEKQFQAAAAAQAKEFKAAAAEIERAYGKVGKAAEKDLGQASDATEKLLQIEKINDYVGAFGDLKDVFEKTGQSLLGLSESAVKSTVKVGELIEKGAAVGGAFGPWGALFGGLAGGVLGVFDAAVVDNTESLNKWAEEIATTSTEIAKLASNSERLAKADLSNYISQIDGLVDKARAAVSDNGPLGVFAGILRELGAKSAFHFATKDATETLAGGQLRDVGTVAVETAAAQEKVKRLAEDILTLNKKFGGAEPSPAALGILAGVTEEYDKAKKAAEKLEKELDGLMTLQEKAAREKEKGVKAAEKAAKAEQQWMDSLTEALRVGRDKQLAYDQKIFDAELEAINARWQLEDEIETAFYAKATDRRQADMEAERLRDEALRAGLKEHERLLRTLITPMGEIEMAARSIGASLEDAFGDAALSAFDHLLEGLSNAEEGFAGLGKALKGSVGEGLKALAKQFAVLGLGQIAEAAAAFASGPFQGARALKHLAAAGLFFSAAAATGVGGAALSRSAGSAGGGGGGASSGSSVGGGGLGRSASSGPRELPPVIIEFHYNGFVPPTKEQAVEIGGQLADALGAAAFHGSTGSSSPRGQKVLDGISSRR